MALQANGCASQSNDETPTCCIHIFCFIKNISAAPFKLLYGLSYSMGALVAAATSFVFLFGLRDSRGISAVVFRASWADTLAVFTPFLKGQTYIWFSEVMNTRCYIYIYIYI